MKRHTSPQCPGVAGAKLFREDPWRLPTASAPKDRPLSAGRRALGRERAAASLGREPDPGVPRAGHPQWGGGVSDTHLWGLATGGDLQRAARPTVCPTIGPGRAPAPGTHCAAPVQVGAPTPSQASREHPPLCNPGRHPAHRRPQRWWNAPPRKPVSLQPGPAEGLPRACSHARGRTLARLCLPPRPPTIPPRGQGHWGLTPLPPPAGTRVPPPPADRR